MKTSTKRTLTGTFALVAFAAVAVSILVLADMFFPKYVPSLNKSTVEVLEKLTPSGAESADAALSGGYYEMATPDNLEEWNENNGFKDGTVIAVYRALKGDFAGAWYVETSTIGFQNGEIVMVTAIADDGTLLKILPRRISDSYYSEQDVNNFNTFLENKPVRAKDLSASTLKPFIHDAAATYTTNGLTNGIKLSAMMHDMLKQAEAAVS